MESGRSSSQLFAVSSLLLILTGVGVYFSHTAMTTSRPTVPEESTLLPYKKEGVPCRLWGDPFEAIYKKKPDRRGFDDFIKSCPADPTKKDIDIQVLLTMIHGSNSEEDHENRIKDRYAMNAGLNSFGYYPLESETIGYFTVSANLKQDPRETSGSEKYKIAINVTADPNKADYNMAGNIKTVSFPDVDKDPNCAIVPYEWFAKSPFSVKTQENDKPDLAHYVLVIWLSDEYFKEEPLKKLESITGYLRRDVLAKARFDFIGPTNSLCLQAMLKEIKTPNNIKKLDIRMYSPWSTASPAFLTYEIKDDKTDEPDVFITTQFKTKGVSFVRMIGSDERLAWELVQELKRREVNCDDPNSIVLISEWDTFYGRIFPMTFDIMLQRYKPDMKYPSISYQDIKDYHRRVRCISYLRGIDGKIPGQKAAELKPSKNQDDSKSQSMFIQSPEYPYGPAQLDYARRLARHLSKQCESQCSKPRVLGIVGSDVYDKILLLQAFREEFDGLIYFVTDMDSRLMHRDNFKWTRNLIVASNYDLVPDKTIKSIEVTFRDDYQTAVYSACRKALELGKADADKAQNQIAGINLKWTELNTKRPRLFEIGRDWAFDLNTEKTHRPLRIYKYIVVILLTLILLLLLNKRIASFRCLWKSSKSGYEDKKLHDKEIESNALCFTKLHDNQEFHYILQLTGLFVLWGGIIIWLILLVYCCHYCRTDEEPFSFFYGISIWPTEGLRLLSAYLCLYFIIRSIHDLRINEIVLCGDFRFKKTSITVSKAKLLKGIIKGFNIQCWDALREKKEKINAEDLWEEYLQLDRWPVRLCRTLIVSLLYMGILWILRNLLDIHDIAPLRGEISKAADTLIMRSSGFVLIFLIWYVVDATRLCIRLIDFLNESLEWPDGILTRLGFKENIAEEDKKILLEDIDDWLTIKLIASRTEVIGKMIFYPFIVMLVLLVARSPIFDSWHWPQLYMVVFVINLVIAVLCAKLMRSSAEKYRQKAIRSLRNKLISCTESDRRERIKKMIEDIQTIRQGAFCSFLENPILSAILLPSGGITILTLIQMLMKL